MVRSFYTIAEFWNPYHSKYEIMIAEAIEEHCRAIIRKDKDGYFIRSEYLKRVSECDSHFVTKFENIEVKFDEQIRKALESLGYYLSSGEWSKLSLLLGFRKESKLDKIKLYETIIINGRLHEVNFIKYDDFGNPIEFSFSGSVTLSAEELLTLL